MDGSICNYSCSKKTLTVNHSDSLVPQIEIKASFDEIWLVTGSLRLGE